MTFIRLQVSAFSHLQNPLHRWTPSVGPNNFIRFSNECVPFLVFKAEYVHICHHYVNHVNECNTSIPSGIILQYGLEAL